MNTKFRILLVMLALCVAMIGGALDAYSDYQGALSTGSRAIIDDSSGTSNFTIGSAAAGVDANEIDTSDVYATTNWNHLTIQVKSSPKVDGVVRAAATALDSGAVTVITQGSNDRLYWKDIDTTTAVDSLPVFEELWFKERSYKYLRWLVKPGTKLDDSGMTANITVNAVNNR